jgi:hypothetical protein
MRIGYRVLVILRVVTVIGATGSSSWRVRICCSD